MNLVVAFCALASIATSNAESPLKTPAGWKAETKDGSITMIPGDVPAGKLYAVVVTMLPSKAGTLDEILAAGKAQAAEIGTFTSATDVKSAKSDGGWDYKFDLGQLKRSETTFVAQIMAIKKGEEGGTVIVLSDSIETMTSYADAFTKSVRSMGVTQAATTGTADLQYTVPPGWVETKVNGFPLLVKERNEEYTKYRVSLLILATEPLSGTIREQFVGYWRDLITPNYETNIAPLPLMARLETGHACAFDGQWDAKANGVQTTVALYMIAHGGKAVPIMAIMSGTDWSLDGKVEPEIAKFLDTARIPETSDKKVPLFDPAKLAGDWKESGHEFANYVTRSGDYRGDASISTASYYKLGSDGSYDRTLLAVGAAGNIKEKDAGTWSVEDNELVLSKGGRFSQLGYGDDPKVGRFLVIGNYANQKTRLKFTNPRGILQALWLRAK